MLEIKNIHFEYDKEILQDVSFNLKQGAFLGIVGKSGDGKTSLLKIIGGYLTPSKGEVVQNGHKLKNANGMLVPGYENIALVHQDFGLDLYHTVIENIKEKVLHLSYGLQKELIDEMISLLDLGKLVNRQAISLSGGEQQRLSIARALVSEADLILLDEPFVHLDSPMRRKLFLYLQKLREVRNTSFIIATHNGEELLGLTDEVIYFKKGRIKRRAKPDTFYSNPRSIEEAEFFGLVNSIRIGEKRLLFRPDQFSIHNNNNQKVEIEFLGNQKFGPLYYNNFRTMRGEDLLLFSFESMEILKCIYV